ncbi:MAG: S-layer homology domain-containing protein [Syntrophomonadaceae bacterium]|nr:S-layer homology domain-containing protein [Syntrophomonadaceae bacterium]
MRKRIISLTLALVMCLSLLPMTALAALPAKIDAPVSPKAALDDDVPGAYMDFTDDIILSFGVSDSIRALLESEDAAAVVLQADWSINSETDWKCSGLDDWQDIAKGDYGSDVVTITKGDIVEQVGFLRSNYSNPAEHGYAHICHGIDDSGNGWFDLENNTVYLKLRFVMRDYDSNKVYSDWTDVFTIGKKVDDEIQASDWAQEELAEADELGLIPDVLEGADLTQDITRAEFAAVAVKVYESLAGTAALPATENPFTDTSDIEVLKAYNIGAVNGTSATTFTPDALLNREQAATMLTRVFKRVTKPGWTLATDGEFTLTYTKPAAFADDADISAYAKDSVYFMAANGIIGGMGNNEFAPKNITTEEQATGYANATREQALLIAVRMVKNLEV